MKCMTGDRGTSPILSTHTTQPTVPIISFSDREPYFLSILLGACTSESIPCRVQFRFVCSLLREDRSGKGEAWILGAGMPWCLGSDFLLGQGWDSSLAAGLLKEDLQRGWFPGSRGFPGARLLQTLMHGQAPHPHLHPGSQAPHPVGTQNFVYHPCQVPGTPKWSQVHYLF